VSVKRLIKESSVFTKRRLLFAFVVIALAGCATTANYEKILNSWVGATELELVRKWGPPQQTYEAGGHKFLAYANTRNVYIAGTAPSYTTTYIGKTAYTNSVGGSPAQNINMSCQTTFEIADEKVVSWQWKGNDCKARD